MPSCDYDAAYPSVVPDEHHGAQLAIRDLVRHGHRAIGFITGNAATPAGEGRLQGYRTALTAAAIAPEPRWIRRTTTDAGGGFRATVELLELAPPIRPTAIVCLNDLIAMGAYQAAAELGLQIPRDLSIIGFDEHELEKLSRPVDQDLLGDHDFLGALGAFDELAAVECRAGTDEGHEVGCVDRTPA